MVFGLGNLFKDKILISGEDDTEGYGKKHILASDGLYLKKENDFFDFKVRIEDFYKRLRLGEEEERFNIKHKVPIEILLEVMAYYRYVDKKYKTEASAIIFYNNKGVEIPEDLKEEYGESIREFGDFVLLIPHHYASSGYTSFYDDEDESKRDKAHGWMVINMIKVMQTHSHNSMPAFWSGTDNNFEEKQFNCLFLVMGNVNTDKPTYRFRSVFNQEFYHLDGKKQSNDPGFELEGDVTHDYISTLEILVPTHTGEHRHVPITLQDAFNLIDFDNYMEIPKDWEDCLNFYKKTGKENNYGYTTYRPKYGFDIGVKSKDIEYEYEYSVEDEYEEEYEDEMYSENAFGNRYIDEMVGESSEPVVEDEVEDGVVYQDNSIGLNRPFGELLKKINYKKK